MNSYNSYLKSYETFRRGFAQKVIGMREASRDHVETAEWGVLLVRCWIDVGQFQKAHSVAAHLLGQSRGVNEDGWRAVEAYGAFAAVMCLPTDDRRERVRVLGAELLSSNNPQWRATGFACEARLLALEVAYQILPITSLAKVRERYERAIEAYRAAGHHTDARDEMLALSSILRQGPPPDPRSARKLLNAIVQEAEECADLISRAKASLAVAEIDLEEALAAGNQEGVVAMQSRFEEIARLHQEAGINGEEASVLEVVGSGMMKFNLSDGAQLVKQAAEKWRASGKPARADSAWRQLTTWHLHRGEMDELIAVQDQLSGNTELQSEMTTLTNALGDAFHASNQGDFVAMSLTLESEMARAVTPGQKVPLLLQESRALEAQGRTEDALKKAELALNLLRPAEPCSMLGEALFHRGMYEKDPEKALKFYIEAGDVAEQCGLDTDAARHWMNLGQALQIVIGGQKLTSSRETAEAYFAKSEALLEGKGDRDSLVAMGNLAQRRGQVAAMHEDYPSCASGYTKAEQFYRLTEQNADLAFILSQQGLVLFQVGRRNGSLDTWRYAIRCFDEAGERFEKQGLRAESIRTLYLAGSAAFECHRLHPSPGEQANSLEGAFERFEKAALVIETLRGGRRELDHLRSISSLEQLASDQQKIYDMGFHMSVGFLHQPEHAFHWLERMKGRALLDSMASVNGLAAPLGMDDALAQQERELEAARDALPAGDPTASKRWLTISRALDDVWETMEKRPELAAYARLRRGRPVEWADWKEAIRKEADLIEKQGRGFLTVHFHWPHDANARKTIFLIGCRADWERPRVVEVKTDPVRLGGFARACFEAPEGSRSSVRSVLKDLGGDRVWQRSFSNLLEPLAEWSQPGDLVGLFSHGPLHGLPLSSLTVDGEILAERNALYFAPSASVQLFVWEREKRRVADRSSVGAAVFGCSLASKRFAQLPRAREEAAFVANISALQASLHIDEHVSRESMLDTLPDVDVIHFVGHGFEGDDGWSSGLQLANEETITALDFHRMRLRADLVTLSGCRTGCNRWRPGDEMVGLVPAFLQAGASSVLASAWEVREKPTELLMRHFYQNAYGSEGVSKAEALRQAVREVRAEFPDLTDWGAFTLSGDWK